MRTILAIDDSIVILTQLEHFAKKCGVEWTFLKAKNGPDGIALAKANKDRIERVFIDYNMEGLNGIEVVDQLSQFLDKSKCVLLTANLQGAIVDMAKTRGIQFLPKPITQEVFNQVVLPHKVV